MPAATRPSATFCARACARARLKAAVPVSGAAKPSTRTGASGSDFAALLACRITARAASSRAALSALKKTTMRGGAPEPDVQAANATRTGAISKRRRRIIKIRLMLRLRSDRQKAIAVNTVPARAFRTVRSSSIQLSDGWYNTNRLVDRLSCPARHGPARPGHLSPHCAGAGGPDEPGHDGCKDGTSFHWPVGINRTNREFGRQFYEAWDVSSLLI